MLLAVLVIVISTLASCVNGRTIKIGFLSALNIIRELRGSAITIAIESVQANGWLQDHEFKEDL